MKSQMADEDTMKCRYCDWRTLKWRTGKDGNKISGWRRMEHHLMKEHDIEVALTDHGE